MALPKRRHSKTRTMKRRTHWRLQAPQLAPCPHCGGLRQSHQVCTHCGYYNNRSVVSVDS